MINITAKRSSSGLWDDIELSPIELPSVMTNTLMKPYRSLGWNMLVNAAMDLASPCKSDKRNRTDSQYELTVSTARRWLLGESDPEMLTFACSLAGVREQWVKDCVSKVQQYPSRDEMKKMLRSLRAKQYAESRRQVVVDRLHSYMDFGSDRISDIAGSMPRTDPVYAFSGPVQKKTNHTRQHNRQTAVAP